MSIEVKNISHTYSAGLPQESMALKDVSFTVEDGAFLGIIGHTGSGKSTLLQHLNGLLKPSSGEIIVDGVSITAAGTAMTDIRKKVGLVFQYPEYQLFDETVGKDVAFGPKNLSLSEEEIEERVRQSLELVGLQYDRIKDKSPFDFSGGQKRRIAIAGVLAMRPSILILDEPTAGLDPRAHADLLEMIGTLHERDGISILLVSHNMNDIARYADKVLVMDKGTVAMQGTPKEVFARGEELAAMGLAVPDLTALADKLTAAGLAVPKDIFTPEEMTEAIAAAIRREGKLTALTHEKKKKAIAAALGREGGPTSPTKESRGGKANA